MCGITGVALRQRADVPLEAMNATMEHRGPDDRGLWWSADGRVGLAQCRLAILDLTPGGHQPMSTADGEVTITFNGEIYNFVDLRRELESLGHGFRSRSDTEVVLAAYRQWGDAFLPRLNGMFAFCLHDRGRRRVLLARDRAGEKPLFYHLSPRGLAFASELKALMADPAFPRRVSPRALDFYLTYGYVPGEMSIFEGTSKLGQGMALAFELDSGATTKWRYWELPAPPQSSAKPEDLVDELEALLSDAVRRQLIADVPVGVLLSGGVDSSLVTALAARASSRPVKTFTISFPGFASHDEAPFARIVAERFGTDHTEFAAEPANVELLPQLVRQYDEPIGDHSMVPTYLVSRLVRREAKVALGGDGGDELFGGYTHYSWLLREERLRSYAPRIVRKLAGSAAAHLLPPGVRGRNHIIGLAGDTGYSIAHINVYFDRLTRERLLRGRVRLDDDETPEAYRASLVDASYPPVRRAAETDFRTTMADAYLVKVDRASMLNSLEIRAPFLDHRVIDFAFGRVPDCLKATESERKILLRRLAARVLPPELDLKRKQGFSMPLDHWFDGDWGRFMTTVLRESDTFDRATVETLIKDQARGRTNATRLFALTVFELWKREYRVSL
jgi:asparagine synthase (glutamine-hydrolysing)